MTQMVELGEYAVKRGGSVNPSKYPDEVFQLFSIPAYDSGKAEVLLGAEIGSSKKCVEPGDVLLSRIVPHIRRCWIVGSCDEHRQIASGEWILFRGDDFYAPYLRHFLLSDPFHSQFMQTVSGVGGSLLRARPAQVYKIKIPLPPFPEQKRIAKILDAADALRAKRRESLAQLDALLQSTFLEMFGDPVENPQLLETVPMGEVCDVRDGTHESPKYVESGFPLLTSKNFKGGVVSFSEAPLISEKDFEKINRRSKVDVGDLVMPMIGTVGNPVLITDEPRFAIKNVALIKFSEESPCNIYVRTLLCSHYFDHVTSKSNRGGTQKFVALKDLRSLPLPVPSLESQAEFRLIVESVEEQSARHRVQLEQFDSLFSALQQQAFAGQL